MILEYTLLIGCIIAIIGSFVLFFQNRKWENLIEKKQNQFNRPNNLRNKKSILYQRGFSVFSVCLVFVIINFNHVWHIDHFNLKDSDAITYETYGSASNSDERLMEDYNNQVISNEEIITVWQTSSENNDNYFVQNYDLIQSADIDLINMVDEFYLYQDDKQFDVMIYQQDDIYYAYFVNADEIYSLIKK